MSTKCKKKIEESKKKVYYSMEYNGQPTWLSHGSFFNFDVNVSVLCLNEVQEHREIRLIGPDVWTY